MVDGTAADRLPINNFLYLFTVTVFDISGINRIPQDPLHSVPRPGISGRGGESEAVQFIGNFRKPDFLSVDPVHIPVKNHTHYVCLIRHHFQRPSLFPFQFFTLISEGRFVSGIFALTAGCGHPGDETAADRLVLASAHEKTEFKVFFIKLVVRIINLRWSDDFSI